MKTILEKNCSLTKNKTTTFKGGTVRSIHTYSQLCDLYILLLINKRFLKWYINLNSRDSKCACVYAHIHTELEKEVEQVKEKEEEWG